MFSNLLQCLKPVKPIEGTTAVPGVHLCKFPGSEELFFLGQASTIVNSHEQLLDLFEKVCKKGGMCTKK